MKSAYYSDTEDKNSPEYYNDSIIQKVYELNGNVSYYFYGERVFFDNMFNLILLILMVQIVAGIIIDTFSSLRQRQEAILEDQTNTCFICGRSRDEIEKIMKSKDAFQIHVNSKHNQWNYIYFLLYLKKKGSEDYTGTESFVSTKIELQDNSWFPDKEQFEASKFLRRDS